MGRLPRVGLLGSLVVVFGCLGGEGADETKRPVEDWEWRHYLGDEGRSHFSPLAQIHRDNVDQLEIAWTYDTGSLKGSLSQIQCNPIIVDGVLYATTSRSHVFALDAATGEERWRFDPTAHGSAAQGHNRGVVHWDSPTGARIMAASGPDLWALDALTGEPVSSFGEGGRVDLRSGLAHGQKASVISPTPGAVYRDLLILGTKVGETEGAAPGDIRAFDLNTGEVRWTFHTIPWEGEFGAETWPAGAWRAHGGANSWAGVTLDSERGIVFMPTGSATPDFWGGDRAGENLFANSLLALDAATGERIWHFQTVHHDLWDRDLPTPPNLVRFEHEGVMVDAVAQPTKSGHLFVFDRETGEPIFGVEERPVHASHHPEEWVSPTQPFPTAPPPFTRQIFELSSIDGDDRAEGFHAAQEKRLEGMRLGENFIPPSLEGSIMYPGFDGGAEWGGAAWDATTGLLYVNANEVGAMLRLMERPKGVNPRSVYLEKCGLCHGLNLEGTGVGPSIVDVGTRRTQTDLLTVIALGSGRMPSFVDMPFPVIERLATYIADPDDEKKALAALEARPGSDSPYVNAGYLYLRDEQGVPINKPPFGTLTAIDLAAGELRWQVPLGDYPHLAEKGIVGAGTENYGGAVVTAGGLLFIAASADETFRAFDKLTGELIWETPLPASGFATPSTYSVDGRQFVVLAAGGGKLGAKSGSTYIAYALP
ncbi:MAG: PQQ-binding-like beta-propeller repeat protein [bacterium]|nr:pyrrolo-quinoline quinone [Deltaproteobacteria bacterium]MCP4904309.1 PQQ-binding-like beta-propeller repeat protein [bacterium]